MPPSWPHKFTPMLNFNDAYSKEKAVFFTLTKSHLEIASALRAYCRERVDRFKNGKMGCWMTDNGKEFHGDAIDGEHGVARELATGRAFSIPYVSNTNPVAELNLGIVLNGIRRCLAHAGAPGCLRPWAATQYALLSYHLTTLAHQPPVSPHEFLNPDCEASDLTWSRVLFCDCSVSLPTPDLDGKLLAVPPTAAIWAGTAGGAASSSTSGASRAS